MYINLCCELKVQMSSGLDNVETRKENLSVDYFTILLRALKTLITCFVSVGLEGWIIALITIGSVVVAASVCVVIYASFFSKSASILLLNDSRKVTGLEMAEMHEITEPVHHVTYF